MVRFFVWKASAYKIRPGIDLYSSIVEGWRTEYSKTHISGFSTIWVQLFPWSMLRRPSAPQWISKWQNIFGTFQIDCEKFWTFWKFLIFHEKIMKIMKNHEKIMKIMQNHENHENHEKIENFRKIFEKIWKIMKNRKFSKSPKFFAFYLESSKNVLPLRNPLGSARPTQHWPWLPLALISSKLDLF